MPFAENLAEMEADAARWQEHLTTAVPPCAKCGHPSDWQIGSYIPFQCTPVYLCGECMSPRMKAHALEQERMRRTNDTT